MAGKKKSSRKLSSLPKKSVSAKKAEAVKGGAKQGYGGPPTPPKGGW